MYELAGMRNAAEPEGKKLKETMRTNRKQDAQQAMVATVRKRVRRLLSKHKSSEGIG